MPGYHRRRGPRSSLASEPELSHRERLSKSINWVRGRLEILEQVISIELSRANLMREEDVDRRWARTKLQDLRYVIVDLIRAMEATNPKIKGSLLPAAPDTISSVAEG